MGCLDIFKLLRLNIIDAGRRQSWGWGGSGVWVGSGVRGGDNGGCQSELLQWAALSICPVSGRGFSCEEAVEAFRGAGAVEDAVFSLAVEAGVVQSLVIK
jgi:hypothetical protein